jgi:hypothetical protein
MFDRDVVSFIFPPLTVSGSTIHGFGEAGRFHVSGGTAMKNNTYSISDF